MQAPIVEKDKDRVERLADDIENTTLGSPISKRVVWIKYGQTGVRIHNSLIFTGEMAGSTGLEPAASGVTGRRSDQLNYDPGIREKWWAIQGLNL